MTLLDLNIQEHVCSALRIEASPPPQDLEEGLSPDARAPAEEREMRPALRGEGGVRGWGMRELEPLRSRSPLVGAAAVYLNRKGA